MAITQNKLGKLGLAILEGFVGKQLGQGFVNELRTDYQVQENLIRALMKTEEIFRKTCEDKDFTRTVFDDLPITDLQPIQQAAKNYYNNPSDPIFTEILNKILTRDLQQFVPVHIEKYTDSYINILTQQLAVLDEKFNAKVNTLANLASLGVAKKTLEVIERIEKKAVPTHSTIKEKVLDDASAIPHKTYSRLVGRSDQLSSILSALQDQTQTPIIAITGMGGIGKTALAREAVELSIRVKAFDNIVWTSAATERFVGEEAVKTEVSDFNFSNLLDEIGYQCGQKDIVTAAMEQKKNSARHLLSNHRLLIVIDNLETVPESNELIDNVFQILGKSKLLITSRHQIRHEAVLFPLHGLDEDEGIVYLREMSKERNINVVTQADVADLVEIYYATGGAPLAMKLVIGQMVALKMSVVLRTLKQAKMHNQDYEFYRFIFKHSWDLLDSNAKKVLIAMRRFAPVIGGTEEAVMAVSAMEETSFHSALKQLVSMSLIDPLGSIEYRRYSLHPLTKYFILSDIVKKWD